MSKHITLYCINTMYNTSLKHSLSLYIWSIQPCMYGLLTYIVAFDTLLLQVPHSMIDCNDTVPTLLAHY